MGAETLVENDFLKRLPVGVLPFKLNLQGNTGWPDRMLLFVHPFMCFIEFKAPGRPLVGERNQPERIQELKERGYHVLVTDSADEALSFLETVSVSTTGRTLDGIAGMRGSTVAARLREDNDFIRGYQNLAGPEVNQIGSGGRPTKSIVQRVAPAEERLGGVQGSEGSSPPWEE